MLRVDLRELTSGSVETRGEVAADDPLFAETDLKLRQPVSVQGRLQALGDGRFYWHGKANAVVLGVILNNYRRDVPSWLDARS